tara:strand:+ start:975 stop:1790 length:816 start_codon:yes stop_codon:yes gene_type:complete
MIPVILIHKGYQEYLGYTIKQANKNNFVHLIGDTNPNLTLGNYEFNNMGDYLEDCDEFRQHYQHLNTTPLDYEVFCYQRWFVLRNFMKQNNLDTVFYIDSDVMLFGEMTKEWEKFNQYTMTLLHRTAAISSFITLEGVTNFCNFLTNTYRDKESYNYKKIASHFNVRRECGLGGGVCDMTLLEFFHYCSGCGGGPGRVGEMMQIIDDSTYDHNINVADQDFAFVNGHKDFKIVGGVPYVYSHKLKKDIKFNSLHFQGGAKNLIKGVYEQCA